MRLLHFLLALCIAFAPPACVTMDADEQQAELDDQFDRGLISQRDYEAESAAITGPRSSFDWATAGYVASGLVGILLGAPPAARGVRNYRARRAVRTTGQAVASVHRAADAVKDAASPDAKS